MGWVVLRHLIGDALILGTTIGFMLVEEAPLWALAGFLGLYVRIMEASLTGLVGRLLANRRVRGPRTPDDDADERDTLRSVGLGGARRPRE